MQFEQSIYRTYYFYRSLPLEILNELIFSVSYTSRLSDTEVHNLIDAIQNKVEDSIYYSDEGDLTDAI